jgi:hypothetical protein
MYNDGARRFCCGIRREQALQILGWESQWCCVDVLEVVNHDKSALATHNHLNGETCALLRSGVWIVKTVGRLSPLGFWSRSDTTAPLA